MDDVARLRAALHPVEHAARSLPWASNRPWRPDTHVGLSSAVPTVDLHDLGRKQAELAVDQVVEIAERLQAGAVFFVVGRGRHSIGGAVLPAVVGDRLREVGADRGWRVRTPRSGRYALIIDPSRAPAAATGALGWGFWLWMAFVVGAALLALARSCA